MVTEGKGPCYLHNGHSINEDYNYYDLIDPEYEYLDQICEDE